MFYFQICYDAKFLLSLRDFNTVAPPNLAVRTFFFLQDLGFSSEQSNKCDDIFGLWNLFILSRRFVAETPMMMLPLRANERDPIQCHRMATNIAMSREDIRSSHSNNNCSSISSNRAEDHLMARFVSLKMIIFEKTK
jgi:hypothetical protein